MENLLLNSQMRAADEYTVNTAGIPSRTLMRRAGACIAEEVIKADKGSKVLVVCGTGNNGGDGYVCARILAEKGLNVSVYAFEGKTSEDCAREKQAFTGRYSNRIEGDVIVDCIFGTGLTREVTGSYAEVIEKINNSGAFVISADIPSGLDGDSGAVLGCAVKADITVAIAEYKAGTFLGDGIDYCGKILKRDIGITCPEANYIKLYADEDIKRFYPARKRNSHKGTYGSANLIAGSEKYIGAAALAAEAALKSGCGYVKLTSAEKVKLALAVKFPQVIYLDEPDPSAQAIAVGMGCGVSAELYKTITRLLKEFRGVLIIDADGLNALSQYGVEVLKQKKCSVILTPHAKEFSRLTGLSVTEILKSPLKYAQSFAENYGVTLLLKGAASIICDGENTAINVRGTTALSKGGSGDMLSGLICGSVARGLSPFEAAVCSAHTLGVSAELSSQEKTDYCVTAKDILNNLPKAVKYLT